EELAEQVRKAEQPMPEVLGEKTVTAAENGMQLTTRATESFSWLRTSSAPSSNPFSMPQPELSTISAVEKAGNDFMKTIFDELDNGEVGVAPNADRSVYYVVQVKNRVPSTPGGEEALRQDFLQSDLFFFFSPYV